MVLKSSTKKNTKKNEANIKSDKHLCGVCYKEGVRNISTKFVFLNTLFTFAKQLFEILVQLLITYGI